MKVKEMLVLKIKLLDIHGRNKRGRPIYSNQGITLVEVMISTVILAVVIVGTISLFAKCSIYAAEIKEHAIVNSALNERMEEIRAMAYSSITALSSTFTGTGFSQLDNAAGTVTLTDTFSDSDITKVTLTVTWTTPQGKSLSKSLSAYFTNEGIN